MSKAKRRKLELRRGRLAKKNKPTAEKAEGKPEPKAEEKAEVKS
jgi:hypothetical protein